MRGLFWLYFLFTITSWNFASLCSREWSNNIHVECELEGHICGKRCARLVYHRLPPVFCQVAVTVHRYPFLLPGREGTERNIPCQEHKTMTPDNPWTQTIQSVLKNDTAPLLIIRQKEDTCTNVHVPIWATMMDSWIWKTIKEKLYTYDKIRISTLTPVIIHFTDSH